MRELEKHIGVVRTHSGNYEATYEATELRHSQPSSTRSSEELQCAPEEGTANRDAQRQQSQSGPTAIAEAVALASASISGSNPMEMNHEHAGQHEVQLCAEQPATAGTRAVLQLAEAVQPTSGNLADKHVVRADATLTKLRAAKLSSGCQDASGEVACGDAENGSAPFCSDHAAPAVLNTASTGLQPPPQAAPHKPFAYGLKGAVLQLLLHMWSVMPLSEVLKSYEACTDIIARSRGLPFRVSRAFRVTSIWCIGVRSGIMHW